jgi:hypothetical protein
MATSREHKVTYCPHDIYLIEGQENNTRHFLLATCHHHPVNETSKAFFIHVRACVHHGLQIYGPLGGLPTCVV